MVGVRVQPDQLARLDAWIAAQPDPKPTWPEAVRRLLEMVLIPPRDEHHGGVVTPI
jgi:hypothetical protein